MHGDDVRTIEALPVPPEEPYDPDAVDPIDDDAKKLFSMLPLVQFDDTKHFAKPARTLKEIEILLKCQGSPYIVQLLGRTLDDKLVFPKYRYDLFMASIIHRSVVDIRKWMIDIVDGITYLHSLGLTYRDLLPRNFLYGKSIVICDLECNLASRICAAPELHTFEGIPESAFTPATDVYGIGVLLQHLCPYIDWLVPPPFDKIYEACTQRRPEDRPTLAQIRAWLEEV